MKNLYVHLLIVLAFSISSCTKDGTSIGDLVAAEKIVIDNFINKQGITVLKEYPKDGVFGDKEYVLLENGVYLHVIDPGNGMHPVTGTEILTLAKGAVISGDDINSLNSCNGFDPGADTIEWPLKFAYKQTNALGWNDIIGEGYMSAMDYVGNNSYVSMIIPFSVGSLYQYHNYNAMFFEKVKFYYD